MTWNNTPPATKALPAATFDNGAPGEKALAAASFDNGTPGEKALAAATFANDAPAEKAMPGVTFDNGAPTQKSVGAAEFALLVDATEFATNGLLDAVLEERDAVTGALVSTKDVETNTAIDPDRELDLQLAEVWASVPAALADRVYLLTTAAGHRYRLVATTLPTLNGDTLSVQVQAHIPGAQPLAAATFSNGSPANKTMPGVTFDNGNPGEKAVAGATFDNGNPGEKTVAGASFDNGTPGEKAVPGTAFDNDPPADLGASDPGASWSNSPPENFNPAPVPADVIQDAWGNAIQAS